MASGSLVKEVTVVCGTKQKLVQVDFSDFANTMDIIRKKYNLTSNFDLQTTAGEKGGFYDIEDDEELQRFKDNGTLFVRLQDPDVKSMTSQPPSGFLSTGTSQGQSYEQPHPPSYETSIATRPRQELSEGSSGDDTTIKIGQVTYSLHEPPPQNSAIVKVEFRNLAPKFEIGSIVKKMDIVAECLGLAYYGVIADAELHKKVQDMQFDVVKLSQLLDRTVVKYRTKAGDIIDDLESGFGYLLDGFEEEALESFAAIGETSTELKELSEGLKEGVDEKKKAIEGVLEHVTRKHRESMTSANEELKTSVEDKQKLIERKKKQAEVDTLASALRCEKFGDNEVEARKTETDATKSASSFSHGFFKLVTFGYYEGEPIVAEQQDKLANIAREDLKYEREELKRFREAEYRANEQLNEFTQSLKTTKGTEDISEKALRGAETGIKSLQTSLESAVNVWDTLHEQCDNNPPAKIS